MQRQNSKGSNSDYSDNEQGTQVKYEESASSIGGPGRGFHRGRGRAGGVPRGGGHQISFLQVRS